jgi:hypothetical protein
VCTYSIANCCNKTLECEPIRDAESHDINSNPMSGRICPRLVVSCNVRHGDHASVVGDVIPDLFWQDRCWLIRCIETSRNTDQDRLVRWIMRREGGEGERGREYNKEMVAGTRNVDIRLVRLRLCEQHRISGHPSFAEHHARKQLSYQRSWYI